MIGAYKNARLSAEQAWGIAAMFRYFSRWATWEAFIDAGAVPNPRPRVDCLSPRRRSSDVINFELMGEVLDHLSKSGVPLSLP
jgi:hypothetical protein